MASIPGEIADALVALLQSEPVQTGLTNAIAAGELPLETAALAFIDGLKANGAVGLVLNAVRGSIDAELKALFGSLPAATIAAYITALAVKDAKAVGG
jgi:hypothetical protein